MSIAFGRMGVLLFDCHGQLPTPISMETSNLYFAAAAIWAIASLKVVTHDAPTTNGLMRAVHAMEGTAAQGIAAVLPEEVVKSIVVSDTEGDGMATIQITRKDVLRPVRVVICRSPFGKRYTKGTNQTDLLQTKDSQ